MITDVEVIVTRETQPLSQSGFGMPLILATDGEKAYAEYTNLGDVAADYPETSRAYKIAARVFGQNPSPPRIAMFAVETPDNAISGLNGLIDSQNDWFFLLSDVQEDDGIKSLSDWAAANDKLYFATTSNLTLASEIESENTVLVYHQDPEAFAAEGWVGRCAPEAPGSITWKFKTINGVTEANITTAQLTQLHEDGGNSYVRKLGVLQTSEGLTTSGEYIDVIRSQYFLKARLTESVMSLFINNGKVPYDNSGIAMIVAACESVLKQATDQGIIALDEGGNGQWTINAPRREDVPQNDVANRHLNGVVIEAVLAGAIHSTTLRVTLTY